MAAKSTLSAFNTVPAERSSCPPAQVEEPGPRDQIESALWEMRREGYTIEEAKGSVADSRVSTPATSAPGPRPTAEVPRGSWKRSRCVVERSTRRLFQGGLLWKCCWIGRALSEEQW